MDLLRSEIRKIKIEISSEGKVALSMLLDCGGAINRLGTGAFPPKQMAAIGMSDGSIFNTLIGRLDKRLLVNEGVYEHPNKKGQAVNYILELMGDNGKKKILEFTVGFNNTEIGFLLAFVVRFMYAAVQLTDDWFYKTCQKGSAVRPSLGTDNLWLDLLN